MEIRVGLQVEMRGDEHTLKWSSTQSGKQLELVGSAATGQILALSEKFESFEKGRVTIEEVRRKLRGLIPGSLEVWLEIQGQWMSLPTAYVRLERRVSALASLPCEEGSDIPF